MRRGVGVGVAAVALAGVVGGCGNRIETDIVGAAALTVDAAGDPVALIASCGAAIDTIAVSQHPDAGSTSPASATDPVVLRLHAPQPPGGTFTVSLTDPAPPWQAEGSFDPAASQAFDLTGFVQGEDAATTSTRVERAAYERLDPQHVVIRESEIWTRAEFDERACNRDAWPPFTES